ncbi:MAG: hypothetical protein B0D92_02725 [Spirochaeta sp. LUC14_002_19_P3]|nr:MAG: hypothetical protein B0D92_02725 [Spirochaeta sp. LUC14_002_19_P3]
MPRCCFTAVYLMLWAGVLAGALEAPAKLWIERAADLLDAPSPGEDAFMEAEAALNAAAEFEPPGPDSFYLQARIALKNNPFADNVPVRRAYELARSSVNFRPFSYIRYSFEEVAFLYAQLALRLKEYRAYLDSYENWPGGSRDNTVLLYAAARSALYLGQRDKAIVLAHRGGYLAMPTDSLAGFQAGMDNPLPAFWAIAAAAGDEASISAYGSAKHRWGEALEEALMPWLLSGAADIPVVRELSGFLTPSAQKMASAVIGEAELNDTKEDLALARHLGYAFAQKNSLVPYTGTLAADSEYDGYKEEIIDVKNGLPVYRRIDANQDGDYEWEIEYSDGSPSRIRLDGGALEIGFVKEAYPEVLFMRRKANGLQGEAEFQTGAFFWDPGSGNPGFGKLSRPDWQESRLWPHIRRIALDTEDGMKRTIVWFVQGLPAKASMAEYPEWDLQKPRWIREFIYVDGIISAGRRSFSTTAEKWELYERYENGKLTGLAWDPAMQGRPLYLKDWALGKYMQVQAWDLDADGWMDVRRFLNPQTGDDAKELEIGEMRSEDLLPWSKDGWYSWGAVEE